MNILETLGIIALVIIAFFSLFLLVMLGIKIGQYLSDIYNTNNKTTNTDINKASTTTNNNNNIINPIIENQL